MDDKADDAGITSAAKCWRSALLCRAAARLDGARAALSAARSQNLLGVCPDASRSPAWLCMQVSWRAATCMIAFFLEQSTTARGDDLRPPLMLLFIDLVVGTVFDVYVDGWSAAIPIKFVRRKDDGNLAPPFHPSYDEVQRKAHVPDSDSSSHTNVKLARWQPAGQQHPHHRVHEALSDLRRTRRGLPGLGFSTATSSSTASTISPRRLTATRIRR